MKRYGTIVEAGVLSVESEDEPLVIGEMDDIVAFFGGETYTIEYEVDGVKAASWIDLDEDKSLTIDVRETLETMDFPETFVSELAERSHNGSPSERTEFFAATMQRIWDEKGNIDDETNPFL